MEHRRRHAGRPSQFRQKRWMTHRHRRPRSRCPAVFRVLQAGKSAEAAAPARRFFSLGRGRTGLSNASLPVAFDADGPKGLGSAPTFGAEGCKGDGLAIRRHGQAANVIRDACQLPNAAAQTIEVDFDLDFGSFGCRTPTHRRRVAVAFPRWLFARRRRGAAAAIAAVGFLGFLLAVDAAIGAVLIFRLQ
jgi:hypothetical protein